MGFSGTVADLTLAASGSSAWANANWSDPLQAVTGAWDSYTPTLSQGASTNISKTVTYAKYRQCGKTGDLRVKLVASDAGTSGSAVTITLPSGWTAATFAASGLLIVGHGGYYDDGTAANRVVCLVNQESTTTLTLVTGQLTKVGVDPALAVASGDGLYITVSGLELA